MNVSVKVARKYTENNVIQLQALLEKYAPPKEQYAFQHILHQMEKMEKTCSGLSHEVLAMREKLNAIQDNTMRGKWNCVINKVNDKIGEIKTEINQVKTCFFNAVKNTLTAVKEKGVSALQNTTEFLKLKPMFAALKRKLFITAGSLDRTALRLADYREGMRDVKLQKETVRRQFFGLKAKEYQPKQETGIFAGLQSMLTAAAVHFRKMARSAESAEKSIDRLGMEKTSVRTALQENRPVHKVKIPAKRPDRNAAR